MISGLAQTNTPPGVMPQQPLAPPPMQTPPPMQPQQVAAWYVGVNGQQAGPYDLAALQSLAAQGQVNAATQVWRQGMAAWAPITQVTELASLLGGTPPQMPPGPPPMG